jgi:hypothetical protein
MLEAEGALKTWALAELPIAGREVSAESLADHRLAYLDYEGPVSNNRGRVKRYDAGNYRATFANDRVEGELEGERLQGKFELIRQSASEWRFVWHPRPS